MIYKGSKVMEEGGEAIPYFGKAKTSLLNRYKTLEKIDKLGAQVIERLDNVPSNAIALGIVQLMVDLNGGV